MNHKPSGVRFAPSPTGQLHIGNLRTAWISYQWAQHLQTPWIVRFEDIDKPRVILNAMDTQLKDMQTLGIQPNQIIIQSQNRKRHWQLFTKAVGAGQIYPCLCSRKEIRRAIESAASAPHTVTSPYSGHCRDKFLTNKDKPANLENVGWRFKSENPSGADDFLVARTQATVPDEASFVPAYHWACAIDDWDGDYQMLVRAVDLAPAVHAQRAVQKWLASIEGHKHSEFEFSAVFHTSVVVENHHKRLEKRTRGVTLAELLSSGFSVKRILQAFEASFDRAILDEFQPGKVFEERRQTLTLSELGPHCNGGTM